MHRHRENERTEHESKAYERLEHKNRLAHSKLGETKFVREQHEDIGSEHMSKNPTSLWFPHRH